MASQEDCYVLLPPAVPITEVAKAECTWKVGKLAFRADFDSANLKEVQQGTSPTEFLLWTKRDCQNTINERSTRTWFYYGVSGHAVGDFVVFKIMNLNQQGRLFSQDYRPWYWSRGMAEWLPVSNKPSYQKDEDNFQLRFSHKFDSAKETFFAFAIPFSYHDTQELLAHLDRLAATHMHAPQAATRQPYLPTSCGVTSHVHATHSSSGALPLTSQTKCGTAAAASQATSVLPQLDSATNTGSLMEECPANNICQYSCSPVQQECQTSPDGMEAQLAHAFTQLDATDKRCNACQACKGTSCQDMSGPSATTTPSTDEPPTCHHVASTHDHNNARLYYHRQLLARSLERKRLDLITITDCHGICEEPEPLLPACAEVGGRGPTARQFHGKKVFFVSSRVHPGETPATHMFNGLLAFLLRQKDPRAAALRRMFVFKLVPMVNPDGVYHGNYRTDTLGQNLNRFYLGDPNPEQQPTIYAIKKLLSHYADEGLLEFYLDLHAHANKKGVFAYGNAMDGEQQVQSLLYAKLISMNNPIFDFYGCNFTEKNMSKSDKEGTSKEGAGRVALFRETGLTHLYTIEANYNTARLMNSIAPASGDDGRASPTAGRRPPPKFTASVLQDVGRSFLIAALDLKRANPWSRIANSEHGTLENVEAWVKSYIKSLAADLTSSPHLHASAAGLARTPSTPARHPRRLPSHSPSSSSTSSMCSRATSVSSHTQSRCSQSKPTIPFSSPSSKSTSPGRLPGLRNSCPAISSGQAPGRSPTTPTGTRTRSVSLVRSRSDSCRCSLQDAFAAKAVGPQHTLPSYRPTATISRSHSTVSLTGSPQSIAPALGTTERGASTCNSASIISNGSNHVVKSAAVATASSSLVDGSAFGSSTSSMVRSNASQAVSQGRANMLSSTRSSTPLTCSSKQQSKSSSSISLPISDSASTDTANSLPLFRSQSLQSYRLNVSRPNPMHSPSTPPGIVRSSSSSSLTHQAQSRSCAGESEHSANPLPSRGLGSKPNGKHSPHTTKGPSSPSPGASVKMGIKPAGDALITHAINNNKAATVLVMLPE